MYTPKSFKVEELAKLHELIRSYNFAILFSGDGAESVATHLPFDLEEGRGKYGTLVGHVARANPQWKTWNDKTEVMVVFQGPHAYISPAWYENQQAVPTWNYASVHAYGRPVLVQEPENIRPMVEKLVALHEGYIGNPWDTSKMNEIMDSQLKAIVGIEIEIERIEGKFKFNQNRSLEDQRGVAEVLGRSGRSDEKAVAELMFQNLDK